MDPKKVRRLTVVEQFLLGITVLMFIAGVFAFYVVDKHKSEIAAQERDFLKEKLSKSEEETRQLKIVVNDQNAKIQCLVEALVEGKRNGSGCIAIGSNSAAVLQRSVSSGASQADSQPSAGQTTQITPGGGNGGSGGSPALLGPAQSVLEELQNAGVLGRGNR